MQGIIFADVKREYSPKRRFKSSIAFTASLYPHFWNAPQLATIAHGPALKTGSLDAGFWPLA